MKTLKSFRSKRVTIGVLFGSILVFAALSFWCVGLRIGVERNTHYYLSNNERTFVIIKNGADSTQDNDNVELPFLLDIDTLDRQTNTKKKAPFHEPYLDTTLPPKNRHSFQIPDYAVNNTRKKTCTNCFNISFDFLIENNVCPLEEYTLFYLIFTKYSNTAQRSAIRETWLSNVRKAQNQSYVFVMGKGPDDDNIVVEENREYRDILLVDFMDSYSHLTFKSIMAFKWVSRRCPQALFVMKVDDDVWINTEEMAEVLGKQGTDFTLGGYCMFQNKPFRDKESKYYASYASYPQLVYPPFCSGTAYLTKINIIQRILHISPDIPFFHLEDVYIGLCLRKLGISVTTISGFNAHKLMPSSCLNKSPFVITSHGLTADELKQIWDNRCSFEDIMGHGAILRMRQAFRNREKLAAIRNNLRNFQPDHFPKTYFMQNPPQNYFPRKGRRRMPILFPKLQ